MLGEDVSKYDLVTGIQDLADSTTTAWRNTTAFTLPEHPFTNSTFFGDIFDLAASASASASALLASPPPSPLSSALPAVNMSAAIWAPFTMNYFGVMFINVGK
jgi:hypothetical protein